MLSASIKISDINYEKTFQNIFPMIRENIKTTESDNLVLRFFKKLDDAALPVLLGIMNHLPEDIKNELLVLCLDTYSGKIQEKLNEGLETNSYGKYLNVGRVSIVQEGKFLYLWIGQVEVDYKGLVKERMAGMIGNFVSFFAGEKLENIALDILESEISKKKLMELAKDALDKYGIVMDLTDIQLIKYKEESGDYIEAEPHLVLSERMENAIMDALAGYLKDKESSFVN